MLPMPLPPTLSSFVGHEDDLAEIARLLDPSSLDTSMPGRVHPAGRLLTLTGPGGIGKSRLAIEAASGLADHLRDGIRFVPLASVSDPDLVVPAIARATGVDLSPDGSTGGTPWVSLQDRQLLLLLDGVE
jgi:predicted ATPase